MQLRTTAGRYAGEIREYSHLAGLAALKAGTATRVTAPPSPRPVSLPPQAERQLTQVGGDARTRRRRN